MLRKISVLIVAGMLVAPPAMARVTKMKVGTVAPQGSPWIESLDLMKKEVKEESGGTLKMKIYPSAQLGDEIQLVEGVQFGTIECAGVSTASIANIVPGMQIFELPFLWESREEAYFVIDNYFRDFFDKKMQAKGMKLLGWSENGWRHFFTTGKLIKTPADLAGLKFRSQESKVHLAFWKALGANAIPLPVNEVYSALERGMINGGENTLVLISATGWVEVIKTLTLTGHIYQPAVMACNKKWWDSLDPLAVTALKHNMTRTEKDMRERLLKAENELVDTFRNDFKIKVYKPTKAELKLFRDKTASVRKNKAIRKLIGEDAFVKLNEGIAAWKKRKK